MLLIQYLALKCLIFYLRNEDKCVALESVCLSYNKYRQMNEMYLIVAYSLLAARGMGLRIRSNSHWHNCQQHKHSTIASINQIRNEYEQAKTNTEEISNKRREREREKKTPAKSVLPSFD